TSPADDAGTDKAGTEHSQSGRRSWFRDREWRRCVDGGAADERGIRITSKNTAVEHGGADIENAVGVEKSSHFGTAAGINPQGVATGKGIEVAGIEIEPNVIGGDSSCENDTAVKPNAVGGRDIEDDKLIGGAVNRKGRPGRESAQGLCPSGADNGGEYPVL